VSLVTRHNPILASRASPFFAFICSRLICGDAPQSCPTIRVPTRFSRVIRKKNPVPVQLTWWSDRDRCGHRSKVVRALRFSNFLFRKRVCRSNNILDSPFPIPALVGLPTTSTVAHTIYRPHAITVTSQYHFQSTSRTFNPFFETIPNCPPLLFLYLARHSGYGSTPCPCASTPLSCEKPD
jgi:hypothetical protein